MIAPHSNFSHYCQWPPMEPFAIYFRQFMLTIMDADITPGMALRYEFSFRATQATDILFDNFAIISANVPLPVTFLGFVARKNNNGTTRLFGMWVKKSMSIVTVVERSTNGSDFSA